MKEIKKGDWVRIIKCSYKDDEDTDEFNEYICRLIGRVGPVIEVRDPEDGIPYVVKLEDSYLGFVSLFLSEIEKIEIINT